MALCWLWWLESLGSVWREVSLWGEDKACLCETVVCLSSATPGVSPAKQYADRCVRLDLSFDPRLRWEPTVVLNREWTSNSVGSAAGATERLVNSGSLRCERKRLNLQLLSVYLHIIDGHFNHGCPPWLFPFSFPPVNSLRPLAFIWNVNLEFQCCSDWGLYQIQNYLFKQRKSVPKKGQIPWGLRYMCCQKDRIRATRACSVNVASQWLRGLQPCSCVHSLLLLSSHTIDEALSMHCQRLSVKMETLKDEKKKAPGFLCLGLSKNKLAWGSSSATV